MSDSSSTSVLLSNTKESFGGQSTFRDTVKLPTGAGTAATNRITSGRSGVASTSQASEIMMQDVIMVMHRCHKAIRQSAAEGAEIVRTSIGTSRPRAIYKGKLANSVKVRIYGFSPTTRKVANVDVTAPHAQIIEYGTKHAKMPPYLPIAQWVAKKIGVPSSYVTLAKNIKVKIRTGKASTKHPAFRRRTKGANRQEQLVRFKQIVQSLRMRIKRRGIRPRNYVGSKHSLMADRTLANVLAAI